MANNTFTQDRIKAAALRALDIHAQANGLASYSQLIAALQKLVPHVLHYGAMPAAHSQALRDAADARALMAPLPDDMKEVPHGTNA